MSWSWVNTILGCIIPWYQKKSDRKILKVAIFSELKNLKIKLVGACYLIQMALGDSEARVTLRWLKNIYEKNLTGDWPKELLEAMDKIQEIPDELYNTLAGSFKASKDSCLNIKKYSLPFIESVSGQLSIFDSGFQRAILEIRDQLNFLNGEIENLQFYYRLTFNPESMDRNKDIIRANINKGYKEIIKRCSFIVDKIDKILDK